MTGQADRRGKRRIVLAFSLFNFLFAFVNWMVIVYLPIYLRNELAFRPGRIGALISMYIATTLLLILPLGYLSDRVSPKRIVQVGAVLFAVYAVLLATARTFWAFAAAQLIGGTGEAVILIVLPALLYKDLDAAGRGRNVGLFIAGSMFGFALGPLASGTLLDEAGLSYPAMFGTVGAVAALLVALSVTLKDAPPLRIHLADYLGDIKRREVLLVVVAVAGMGVHFGQERTSYPLFLRNIAALSPFQVGLMYALLGSWMGAFTMLIGRLFDRHAHLLGLIGVGLALSGGMHMVTPYVGTFGGVLAVRAVHTAGDVSGSFCYCVVIASIFPQPRLGGNTGFMLLFRAVGGVVGAAVAGPLDAAFPSLKASFAVAGLAMIGCGAVLFLNRRTLRRLLQGVRAPGRD
jgi:MFS family permease